MISFILLAINNIYHLNNVHLPGQYPDDFSQRLPSTGLFGIHYRVSGTKNPSQPGLVSTFGLSPRTSSRVLFFLATGKASFTALLTGKALQSFPRASMFFLQ